MDLKQSDDFSDEKCIQNATITALPYSRATTLVASPASPAPAKVLGSTDRHYWRVASAFICFFSIGWGDASIGVILPEMQAGFDLSYTLASMLFVTGSAGFAIATVIVQPLDNALGRFALAAKHRSVLPVLFSRDSVGYSAAKGRWSNLLVFGLLHSAYFLIATCSPHYYGVLIGFFLGGIAKSILVAQMNVYWATTPRLNGIASLHGMYGVGAFLSPLISQILRARGVGWRNFFWVSMAVALLNAAFCTFSFRVTKNEFEVERQLALASKALSSLEADQKDDSNASIPGDSAGNGRVSMLKVLAMPYVWMIAIFLGVYQGAETVAQGFIVTFLLRERSADPDTVGYVATGFWAGLALGRIVWGFISPRISQRGKIYYVNAALVLGISFHVAIWKVQNLLVNAIIVSLLGLLVGPTFPLVLDIASTRDGGAPGKGLVLPTFAPNVQLTAFATVSSMGSIGAAIFPLLAGVLANKFGAFAVEPLAMATLASVLSFWLALQIAYRIQRRRSVDEV